MKIVHFECGLGNQMTCYANYLLVKHNNPEETIYAEKLVYDIDRHNLGISQWNGFELERIFGIHLEDISDYVEDKKKLLKKMEMEYIKSNGQFNSYSAVNALKQCGLKFEVSGELLKGNSERNIVNVVKDRISKYVAKPGNTVISYLIKKQIYKIHKFIGSFGENTFSASKESLYYPLSFDIMKNEKLIRDVENELRKSFIFPSIIDEKNQRIQKEILSSNSVSIHARRSDFLQYNSDCYKYGYFKKATKYIKRKVDNPSFFIFSEDTEWCRENLSVLGLTKNDIVFFIDWNKDSNSYIDMQLMSCCKHNIITKSSFGWWAAYLNNNPNKIIVSQVSEYTTGISF